MTEKLTSNDFDDEVTLNNEENDYKDLINRLQEIKTKISLLEEKIFK